MYLAENFNLTESAVFYQFLRNALLEQVSGNPEIESYLKEASDDTILSYAVLGKAVPSDVDTVVYEQCLLDRIKDVVVNNASELSECFSENVVSEFIQEIGSLQMADSQTVLNERSWFGYQSKSGSGWEGFKKDFVKSDNKLSPDKIVGDEGESIDSGGKLVKNPLHTSSSAAEKAGGIMGWFNKMKDKFANSFPTVSKYIQDYGKQVGVAAIIAIAGYLSYKAYQNYFSKAARACTGKSGEAKTLCMQNYKKKATQERMKVLQKSMSLCKNSNNPAKCKSDLQAKIAKLRQKI